MAQSLTEIAANASLNGFARKPPCMPSERHMLPPKPARRTAFAYRTFLQMFVTSLIAGVVFSAAAVAMTLLLVRTSEAKVQVSTVDAQPHLAGVDAAQEIETLAVSSEFDVLPINAGDDASADGAGLEEEASPGSLYVSDGCMSFPRSASEREWLVTLRGDVAEIQVMQTFFVPLTYADTYAVDQAEGREDASPWFHAVLPRGASLLDWKLDTESGQRNGVLVAVSQSDARGAHNEPATSVLRGENSVRVFVSGNDQQQWFSTDALNDLLGGQTVVVTYRYEIALAKVDTTRQLVLSLAPVVPADDDHVLTDDTSAAAGTVWVRWQPDTVRALSLLPTGALIEQLAGAVVGVSWATQQLEPNARFVLAWRE
jgi:hypothetical protein